MASRRGKVALVVEGGAMRGAYAAGAVIESRARLGPELGGIFAVSSGAGTAAYAAAGQEEGLGIWQDHLHGSQLVHPWRLLWGGAPLDVDYLVDTVFCRRVPLDVGRLRRFPGPLEVPVTHARTGEAAYFDLRRTDPFPVLKATTSLPGAIRRPVLVEGEPYVDGGVADPIPIARALEHGFERLVVILTRPAGYRKPPEGRLARWLVTRDFPSLRESVRRQPERYNASLDLLARLPEHAEAAIVRPSPRLGLSRWMRARRDLLRAIEAGRRDAAVAIEGFLAEPARAKRFK